MDEFVKFHSDSNFWGEGKKPQQSPAFPINLIDQTEEEINLLVFQLWELQ